MSKYEFCLKPLTNTLMLSIQGREVNAVYTLQEEKLNIFDFPTVKEDTFLLGMDRTSDF